MQYPTTRPSRDGSQPATTSGAGSGVHGANHEPCELEDRDARLITRFQHHPPSGQAK